MWVLLVFLLNSTTQLPSWCQVCLSQYKRGSLPPAHPLPSLFLLFLFPPPTQGVHGQFLILPSPLPFSVATPSTLLPMSSINCTPYCILHVAGTTKAPPSTSLHCASTKHIPNSFFFIKYNRYCQKQLCLIVSRHLNNEITLNAILCESLTLLKSIYQIIAC